MSLCSFRNKQQPATKPPESQRYSAEHATQCAGMSVVITGSNDMNSKMIQSIYFNHGNQGSLQQFKFQALQLKAKQALLKKFLTQRKPELLIF